MTRRAVTALAPAFGIVVFLAAWELIVRTLAVRPFVLRAPTHIVAELADQPGPYWRNSLVTAREAAIGFLVALAVSFAWGSVLAASRIAERAALPLLLLAQVTPFAAYAPSVVLWMGGIDNWRPIVLITAIVCTVPFTFAVIAGLRSADPAVLELLRSVDARRWEVLWHVRLPSSLPYVFTAARVNVGLALIAAWLSETYALTSRGLGQSATRASSLPGGGDVLWACVFCVAALGIIGLLVVDAVERGVLRWHVSQRRAATGRSYGAR